MVSIDKKTMILFVSKFLVDKKCNDCESDNCSMRVFSHDGLSLLLDENHNIKKNENEKEKICIKKKVKHAIYLILDDSDDLGTFIDVYKELLDFKFLNGMSLFDVAFILNGINSKSLKIFITKYMMLTQNLVSVSSTTA